ncbi:MAG: hypothetical protein KDA42_07915 [Planctomycetales bacterium]|nr:hypothetical protein [Planctomycetales bacterium]
MARFRRYSRPAFAFVLPLLLCGSLSAADVYEVHCRPHQVGDVTGQETALKLDLKIKVMQFGQLIDSTAQGVDRRQSHRTEVLATNAHGASRVRVVYSKAQQTIASEGQTVDTKQEPVTGKTYHVERVGEELVVTDANGQQPSDEEIKFIVGNFQFLGRPNPLWEFLDGRQFTINERVVVPDHLAGQLLGMSGGVDKPEDLGMTLTEVREIQGRRCGIFKIDFTARSSEGNMMSMKIDGSMALDLATGRAVEVGLSGPVALNETRGPKEGRYDVNTTGKLELAIRATGGQQR